MDSQIQFESEGRGYARPSTTGQPPFITSLVIKCGLARDERGAKYVLLGVAVIAIVLAFVIPSVIGTSSQPRVPQTQIDAAIRAMNARQPSSSL